MLALLSSKAKLLYIRQRENKKCGAASWIDPRDRQLVHIYLTV